MVNIAVISHKTAFMLHWAWREIRQGQLWLVTLALSLIIGCVFALSALVSRVEAIIVDQGRSALAADRVLVSSQPIDLSQLQIPATDPVKMSQQTRFGTMVFSNNGMQLVSVKAVDALFPLRGELGLEGANTTTLEQHVQPQQLWLAERLFSLLNVNIGDMLMVGDTELKISGRITQDPELSFNPFSQMPTVFIHQQDINAVGGVQPGSRISYRYYFTGSNTALDDIRQQLRLTPSQRWLTENDAGRSGDFIERARQYLSLTLVLVVLMAAATLVLTCQHYAVTRKTAVAMMKSLGASRPFLWRWLLTQISLVFVVAIIIGLTLGFGLEWLLRYPLQNLLPNDLPPMGLAPIVISLLLALLIALPALGIPLSRLVQTASINSVQALIPASIPNRLSWLLLSLPLLAAIVWIGSNLFVWLTLLGMAVLLIVLALVGVAAIALLQKIQLGAAYRLALSRVNRSKTKTATQLVALTCSLMLLAVIGLLRNELLADWQHTLPADAPNVFALNIAPEQQQRYLADLDKAQLTRSQGYPVTRGRLVAINDQRFYTPSNSTAIDQSGDNTEISNEINRNADDDSVDPALKRELNFTWATTLPTHNVVTKGQWGKAEGVSVESGIAKRLNINLGDKLAFTVGGREFNATVNSIRDVEWRNMKPNFYFIFTPDVLQSFPATGLVSFRVGEQQNALLNTLASQYPTVTVLDLRMMATRIQGLLAQVSWSLTVLAGLGVVSGLLLIMTLLRLSISERQTEIQLYRTLGASRKRIAATLWFEYGIIALLAGIIAAVGAEFVVGLLVVKGFELPFSLHPLMWLGLPVLAIALVYLVSRSQINKLLLPLR
ncbi:ABC transporter permease [Photobacterium aquimaris]|uniref:ABC transporter permease n=1 Tax=Photobacterium aquimaris TaxID=512643 RepID=A0A2T3IGX8_9GAMM|nr:FtsX-like permease family protein [Photobacterium aquimaris]OBU11994.1 ABC transporter permease [Photobacterium aquimaris]OBU23571.1 ABC transporter permease [Photobacterium aquimaris]PSU26603.1 ABC transporter permease [Photobacterium aquimaris]PSW02031.1 ABC transporter permease [Photobacterium aquimaris]